MLVRVSVKTFLMSERYTFAEAQRESTLSLTLCAFSEKLSGVRELCGETNTRLG
jgi:hypothetical protein